MVRVARITALLLVLLVASGPALAGKARKQSVLTSQIVSTAGGAVTAIVDQGNNSTGYLVVTTSAETATASLAVLVEAVSPGGNFTLCTATAIVTETTTAILIGSPATAAEGITDVCAFPTTRQLKFTFTVTGAGADFTVVADMEWFSP